MICVAAVPVVGGVISYTPNIAWLMTLVMVMQAPGHWPRGVAFGLGLLQDVLFGTPLGAQALLALLLAQWLMLQRARGASPPFRVRWLEAGVTLVLLHLLLWVLLQLVGNGSPPLTSMLLAGVVNGLWYPVFYAAALRLFAPLMES